MAEPGRFSRQSGVAGAMAEPGRASRQTCDAGAMAEPGQVSRQTWVILIMVVVSTILVPGVKLAALTVEFAMISLMGS